MFLYCLLSEIFIGGLFEQGPSQAHPSCVVFPRVSLVIALQLYSSMAPALFETAKQFFLEGVLANRTRSPVFGSFNDVVAAWFSSPLRTSLQFIAGSSSF